MEYQRWLIKILGYDFDIVYKPGRENAAADGLSRMTLFALTIPTALKLQDLCKEVDSDKQIQELKARVLRKEDVKPGYTVKDDRLYYKNCLVISRMSVFIPLILQEYHSSLLGGHAGIFRMKKRIQNSFH